MHPPRSIYTPPGGPPTTGRPDPAIYQAMGTDAVFRMLEDFYRSFEGTPIRHLFPDDLVAASKKSAAFFVFVLGGPPLYQQLHGSPMLRKRHMPFRIDEHARRVWLDCFRRTLEDADTKYGFPMEHMESFDRFLDEFSAWMVNTADEHTNTGDESSGHSRPAGGFGGSLPITG